MLNLAFFRVLLPSSEVLANYSTRPMNVAPAEPPLPMSTGPTPAAVLAASGGVAGVAPTLAARGPGGTPLAPPFPGPSGSSLANIEGKVEAEFTDELLVQVRSEYKERRL